MKKFFRLSILTLAFVSLAYLPIFADDLNSPNAWTEMPWYRGPYGVPGSSDPLTLNPFYTDDFRSSGTSVFVSKSAFSLTNNFQLDVKYLFPESFNDHPVSMRIGFIQNVNQPSEQDFAATPSFAIGRSGLGLGLDYALTQSEHGSIRMAYDPSKDKLTTTVSSFDQNGKIVKNEVKPEEPNGFVYSDDFKKRIQSDKVRLVTVMSDGIAPDFFGLSGPLPEGQGKFYDVKVTAAPEPITTTLFLVGGGVMAAGRLRRKKV